MQTPTSDSVAIVRAGLANSPMNRIPAELRLDIMQLFIRAVRKVVVVPTAMTRKTIGTPALRYNEPQLVFTTTNPLANTCTLLHEEYTNALKLHALSGKVLNGRLVDYRMLTIELHVLDFDFSLITHEIFSKFTAAHRRYYNTRPHSISLVMTITDAFARLPDEHRLGKWLEWRDSEESAGRGVRVNYKVRLQGSTKGVEEMESIRYCLLLYDPYSDATEKGGDLGKIMLAMQAWFQQVANAR